MVAHEFMLEWKKSGLIAELQGQFALLVESGVFTEQEANYIRSAKDRKKIYARWSEKTKLIGLLMSLWLQCATRSALCLWESWVKLGIASPRDANLGMWFDILLELLLVTCVFTQKS